MQIYFDFSGYSDMARGLGRMLGFEFMENFSHPYISKSITEFWRRWHISLSTWFRDYVYIPLGGNRVKPARMYLNLFAVWFLTGLWHGASMNFILWGLYYFVILVIEKRFLMKFLDRLPAFLRHVYTMFLVILGWVLFYFDTGLADCFGYLSAMFGNASCMITPDALNITLRYLPILAVACIAGTPLMSGLWKRIDGRRSAAVIEIVLCMAGLVLCTAVLASQSYNPFLYFKF
jgi:alginate O-acetyltransferase complex protein AlgI